MQLFSRLDDLRESLMAARILREEIVAAPVTPLERDRVGAEFAAANAEGYGGRAVLDAALGPARAGGGARIDAGDLVRIAEAAGGGGARHRPGHPFHGQPSPPAADVPELLAELLETVNSAVAAESWPPPLRAVGLHFLIRVVQPFEAPAALVGAAAEAMLLGADGFPGDRMLLPEPDVIGIPAPGRVDPDAFARARVHRLIETLGETRERLRASTARSVLLSWIEERAAGLSARQEQLVRYLAEGDGSRKLTFRDYVGLHAGRRAPALRTLQRDWQVLREAGWLAPSGDDTDAFTLSTAPLEYGG